MMYTSPNGRRSSCALALLSVLAAFTVSAAVMAQETVMEEEGMDDLDSSMSGQIVEEVVVTGSRIARTGFDTPTPVSIIDEAEIEAATPGSITEFVISLPTVRGSTTASTNSGSLSAGGAGISALNLRALGTGRTLVLFDGQRSVVSASTGEVDTNTFPQSLVERVEIVTGGASSAYGSDAISGVVNFILDKDFTGVKTAIQYGETSRHDNPSEKLTFTAGTPFADSRGHFLFSAESYDSEGIHYTTRDWAEKGYFGIVNPDGSPGAPHFLVDYDIGISNYTPGGLIVSGPLMGTYFGEGGSVNQLTYGAVSGQWMQGGDWQYTTSGELGTNSLAADDERNSIFTRAAYTLDNDVELFVQASYAEYEGYSHYINPTDRNITIFADNAFLPGEIVTQMSDLGLASFRMSTSNADMPASGSNNKRDTTRIVLGANGSFGEGWGWDAYYQHGLTDTDEHQLPTFNFDRLAMATDAVFAPGTTDIVCRSTLADPTNGCVPLNRFGVGVASRAGLDYVLGRPRREQEFQQDVASINFTTPDIDGWAGPISLAFGAEWRKEQMTGFVEDQYISGWKYGNYKVTEGEYDVSEIYVETAVPLTGMLEFNGAARYTDYSTSGGVNTWKAGLVFSPTDSLTFRLTQSHDIRAPNLSELYAAGTARTNAVAINGASTPFIQNLQGNPVVAPEEADTLGVGVVFRPGFAPGFAASIDYYDIEIDGVIDFIAAQDVADACFIFGVQRYCDNINYVNGVLSTIDLYYENLNIRKAKGVDLEAAYSFDVAGGSLTLRGLATHYIDNITDDGVTIVNDAGSNLQDTPDWVYRLSAMYALNDWTFNLTARGVSDGVINNDYIECASSCPASVAPNYTINDNSVPGEWYFDAYVSNGFSFGGVDAEFYLSVRNLFDTDPVLVANPASQGSENRPGYLVTNRDLYDVLGRTFRLGVRFDF